jgi:hypothetical protein
VGKQAAKTRTSRRVPGQTGPGLAKAGRLPLLEVHATNLVRCSDYLVRELFERADVMSEGAVDSGRGAPTYYGTTSILIALVPKGRGSVATLRYLHVDPHARTRAIRIACREAQVRCQLPLRRIRAELNVRTTRDGVHFDVEVEAAAHDAKRAKRR